ncbi:hypothetical protein TVAG_485220 [Trichomonas vaginalis G3]|uniref:Choline transporter-like protein n=1 Tax=Trichomonas vaginalis (strain ATCC PRA-98 / G3) TaxID=412133 RepID=A2EZ38_TRIV3|nr:choline transmembrane transporter protein [Trichomonas vaginalis G3]EAY02087.1 hypothetical protein TVAG_485220 [Trichomonas vaginalis G3]KAI5512757.1 choline transmembrane transporter protein [Trichomonas vaginalis G3]|eukprot:XP_001330842.1 hypothetical protein [Trichomonas vaginalis G3]
MADNNSDQSLSSHDEVQDPETPYEEPPKEESKQEEKPDKVEGSIDQKEEDDSKKSGFFKFDKITEIKGVLTLNFKEPDPAYLELWGTPRSFTEEKFANHFVVKRKWTQITFSIVFWINLILALILFAFTDPAARNKPFEYKGQVIPAKNLHLVALYSVGTSVVLCAFIICLLLIIPGLFIWWTFLFAVFTWAVILVLIIIGGNLASQISFSVIVVAFPALFVLKICGKVKFSTCVLKSAILVARKYPSTFLFTFLMICAQTGINYLYDIGVTAAYYHNISPGVYIYAIWSYFFITATLRNYAYTVVAGVASCWYFLNGSPHMPPAPLIVSIRHMTGPTFGPVCLGGLIQSFCDTINQLNDTPGSSPIYCIVKCICMVVKCMVTVFMGIINRFALIYCAMFGVDTQNATKRWYQQKSRKMVNQCILHTVLQATFDTDAWISSSLCGAVASYFAYKKFGKGSSEFNFATVTGTFFGKQAITLLSAPIITMSDALFVGFGEAPQRLDSGASEIMDLFDEENKQLFRKEIDEQLNGPDEKKFCCC